MNQRTGSSTTAQAIAAARAVGLRGLYDPVAAHTLSDARRRLVGALRATIEASPTGETVVNTLTAGLAGHAALRMAAVDAAVETGREAGCRQVVVVGAGYDTRAWRMSQLSGCHVVEIDLPTTQARKQHRLRDLTPVTPVMFAPADLARDSLPAALAQTGHDPGQPTMWIWEAVAPYLPRQAVLDTIDAIARLSPARSHLAMSVARPELIGRGAVATLLSPAARGLFAGIGEPLRSTFADDDITAVLAEAGFHGARCAGPDDWARAVGRSPLPDAFAAERLVTAHT